MSACGYTPAENDVPDTLYLEEGETCLCDQLSRHQYDLLVEHLGPGGSMPGSTASAVGSVPWDPRARRALSVAPAFQPGALQLTAGAYVGVVTLADLRIVIRPKVPIHNLFYMLTYAYDVPEFLRQPASLAEADDLFHFIVEIFVGQVELLVQRGIYRTYVNREEDERFLRGRLLLADQLRRNVPVAMGFCQRTSEYTADVMENRILRYTLWLLSRLGFCKLGLRQRIRRLASAFADVSLVPVSPADCDAVLYTRLNELYRSRIHLARLIIRNLSLEGRTGSTRFASYLFDMSNVFELFVSRFLQRHFASDPTTQVESQQPIWLDDDKKEEGIPDIVLRVGGRGCVVLDTKYKVFEDKAMAQDRDQVVVYCRSQGWQDAVLIFPNPKSIDYHRRILGVQVRAVALPLDGTLVEFKARCARLGQELAFGGPL